MVLMRSVCRLSLSLSLSHARAATPSSVDAEQRPAGERPPAAPRFITIYLFVCLLIIVLLLLFIMYYVLKHLFVFIFMFKQIKNQTKTN